MIRVLIADDQKRRREGLAMLLGLLDGIEVVGTAVDGEEAWRQARSEPPDVVLMDLHMPRVDGVEATRAICARAAADPGVVLTTYADDDSVFRALQAGARGFLTKDAGADEIQRGDRLGRRGPGPARPVGAAAPARGAAPAPARAPGPARCPTTA